MRLKKIFIAMLSLAMLFALCACDSEEQLTGGYLTRRICNMYRKRMMIF